MGSHPKSTQNPLQTSIIYAIIKEYIRQNAGHGNPENRIRINRKEVFFTMDASTFPISFAYHLIFCLIAGAFFVVQFIRLRRPYQLLLAVGIVASLLIYVGGEHNKVWFHTVGIFELVLLLGAIVLSIIARKKEKQAAAAPAADTAGDSKTEETDA
mgnify:CR=1 FL=1